MYDQQILDKQIRKLMLHYKKHYMQSNQYFHSAQFAHVAEIWITEVANLNLKHSSDNFRSKKYAITSSKGTPTSVFYFVPLPVDYEYIFFSVLQ